MCRSNGFFEVSNWRVDVMDFWRSRNDSQSHGFSQKWGVTCQSHGLSKRGFEVKVFGGWKTFALVSKWWVFKKYIRRTSNKEFFSFRGHPQWQVLSWKLRLVYCLFFLGNSYSTALYRWTMFYWKPNTNRWIVSFCGSILPIIDHFSTTKRTCDRFLTLPVSSNRLFNSCPHSRLFY